MKSPLHSLFEWNRTLNGKKWINALEFWFTGITIPRLSPSTAKLKQQSKAFSLGNSVVRTWCFHCGGPGLIPGQGTKILQAEWHGPPPQKRKSFPREGERESWEGSMEWGDRERRNSSSVRVSSRKHYLRELESHCTTAFWFSSTSLQSPLQIFSLGK